MAQFSGKHLQVSFPLKWNIPLGLILHAHTQNASTTTSSTFLWRRPKIDLKARPLLTLPRYLLQFLDILIQKRSLKVKASWWANRSVNVCNIIIYAELIERNSLFDVRTQNKLCFLWHCEFPSCQVMYLGALLCFKCRQSDECVPRWAAWLHCCIFLCCFQVAAQDGSCWRISIISRLRLAPLFRVVLLRHSSG